MCRETSFKIKINKLLTLKFDLLEQDRLLEFVPTESYGKRQKNWSLWVAKCLTKASRLQMFIFSKD